MGLIDVDHAGLVVAAQAGDDLAREELIAAYLPLVYNIVGRALSGHADVDDVVQETLLRVVRDLPAVRAPESFRSWLVSITLRQINTHLHRKHAFAERTAVIDEAYRIPDSRRGACGHGDPAAACLGRAPSRRRGRPMARSGSSGAAVALVAGMRRFAEP